jgi:hypothetical protein
LTSLGKYFPVNASDARKVYPKKGKKEWTAEKNPYAPTG